MDGESPARTLQKLKSAAIRLILWLDEQRDGQPCDRCGGRAVKQKLTNGGHFYECRDCELLHFPNGYRCEPGEVRSSV